MAREKTVNSASFAEAAKKNWYLSVKSPSPKQTLSIRFVDGKEYKYLGTGKVNIGDPAIIDYGGATSYMMGNVVKTEDGITIKRTHALKPLFAFSTDPGKPEIKANSNGMLCLDDIGEVSGYFNPPYREGNEDQFRIVDYLVLGILNAITVVAYQGLATPDSIKEAKALLAKEKPIPGKVFGKPFTDRYYGVYASGLRFAETAEVAFTGFYPGWEEDLLGCSFWSSDEYKELKIDAEWNDEKTVYYLYFTNGSKKRADYFSTCEEFLSFTNEVVFRSALSILIRGGFTNLLKAALSVEMPIKGFYQKLIAFADEIGSTECSKLLKSIDYENAVFEKATNPPAAGKKASTPATDKHFKIKDAVLIEYTGKQETVMIPEGVKTIGEFAFSENKSVRKVIFPDSVTQVKKCAFSFCSELEEVVLGKNVSSFGTACFYNCDKLTTVNLSDTKVKTLPKETFAGCTKLEALDLGAAKIVAIKDAAFRHSGLKNIVLPQKLETIEDSAFDETKITELSIPATVKEISSEAFLGLIESRSDLQRIVFEGTAPLKFWVRSVGLDCVIVCKSGSELLEMLEEQNAKLEADSVKYPSLGYAPRKLEEY